MNVHVGLSMHAIILKDEIYSNVMCRSIVFMVSVMFQVSYKFSYILFYSIFLKIVLLYLEVCRWLFLNNKFSTVQTNESQ